jgi:hypothetical protein
MPSAASDPFRADDVCCRLTLLPRLLPRLFSQLQAKSTEPVLLDFLRAPQSGALLPPALLQVSPSFCSVLTSIGSGRSSRFGLVGQQMLVNLLLLGCKWIRTRSGSEPPQQGEPAAAMVRRLHGMKLLLALLKRSKGFLAVSKTLQMLLRAVIVPTLVHAATVALSPSTTSSGGNPADTGTLLSLVLSTHIYLTDHLQAYISSELAHMNTHLWIPAISGTWTTLHQKQLVLELQRHVFRGPRQVMTTYYNHRYLTREWKPVEDLVAALIQLLEGEVESCPEVTSASLGAPSSDAGDAVSTVRLLSFQLLVHLLAAQAQWIGVPGVKRPANSESGQQQLPRPMTDQGASKKSEWQATIQQQQRDQQLEDQALQLSRGGKIKAALRYLQQMRPCAGSISEMARYLYETEGLNPADVGDFLANLDDDFLTAAQYGQLRLAYTRLIDFTGLSFPESLRRFLCDSGFRLPGEAQKIDRMLEAFCSVFVALNPTSFRDSSSAFIVCFALVMLNTDLHDPRLKGGGKSGGSSASSRTPMTLKQFISNLRGVDAGGDFPSEFLTEMYDNIRLKGMEWKEEEQAGGAGGREGKQGSEKGLLSGLSKRGSISQADRLQLQLGQVDRTLMQIRRRLESHLRRARERQYGWSVPTRSWLVAPLFDSTWYRCLGTISLLSSHSTLSLHHGFDGGSSSSQASVTSTRFDALKICLDGLAYGATIAMVLGSKTEYDAYLSVLAQVIYVENARSEHRKKVMVEELKMRQKTTSVKVSAAATNEIASLSTSVPTADAATSAPSDSTPTASTSSAFNAEASWAKFDQQLGKKLAKRHHLKQDWFLRLSSSDLAPDTICRSILSLCTQTKQTVNQRIRQARLKQLQETMGEVALVCIGRDLLKEGVLGKFKNSSDAEHSASSSASASDPSASSSAAPGEKRQFQFVLCTDVFFYARPGKAKGSPLQLRSTYQLALMEKPRELRKLDDPQGGSFPFVFSTAQSLTPVQLSASSPQERKDWINILCQQIDVIRTRFATALSLSDVRVSKRLSKFIGSAEALGTDEDASSSSSSLSFPHDTFCRLCLKSYHPLFRRPTTCEWCGERVCGECATGKVRVPQMLHVHASVQKHSGLSSSSSSSDDPSTSELSPTNSSSAAPAAPAKTSFFSKASASVNSMGSKLRHAVSKLEAERDTAMNGGVRITVCAACHLPLTTECDEFDSMQRGTSTNK